MIADEHGTFQRKSEKVWGLQEESRLHPLGTMNVCISCQPI